MTLTLPIQETASEPELPSVIDFIQSELTLGHSHQGEPFDLMPWQQEVLKEFYQLTPEGEQRYNQLFLEIARKNGKSQLVSALCVYHLVVDNSAGSPNVIGAAFTKEQARIIFSEAKRMILSSPLLKGLCIVKQHEILCPSNGGSFRVVAAEENQLYGLNPSVVVMDELHTYRNEKMYNALSSSFGARSKYRKICITTAGHSKESFYGKLRSKISELSHFANGELKPGKPDLGILFWYYGPEPGVEVDHTSWEDFKKYNPNHHYMTEKYLTQSNLDLSEAEVRQQLFNEWTAGEFAFLPLGKWQSLEDSSKRLEPGDRIVLGGDFSYSGDSTAVIACRIDDFHMEPLVILSRPDKQKEWTVPISDVKAAVLAAAEKYDVVELAFDPYWTSGLMQELDQLGVLTASWPTSSISRMIPAVNNFYSDCIANQISHNGHGEFSDHVNNAVLTATPQGSTIKKSARRQKIDALVAAIIAHSRAVYYKNREDEGAAIIPEMIII